jgi:hypothetical protein
MQKKKKRKKKKRERQKIVQKAGDNIVLKPTPVWDLAEPGLEPGRIEGKIRCDPARSGQKSSCNPLNFVFFN